MSEAELERRFVKYAKECSCIALKLVLLNRRGFPDRTVIANRRILFIEFKTPEGKLSAQQKWWGRLLGSYGFDVYVARDLGEAKAKLREFLDDHHL